MKAYSVTYDIVTPESAEYGGSDEYGFISEGKPLRDAIQDLFHTRTSGVSGIECIECSDSCKEKSRWITIDNGMEYESGACERRSLHRPQGVTDSSWLRIINLIGG